MTRRSGIARARIPVLNPNNPYIVYNDLPKLENLKKTFPILCRR